MNEQIVKMIKDERLIAIVRGVERDKLIPLVSAMYDGGVKLLEITYSSDGAVPDEQIAERIKMLNDEFGDKVIIGAGTVLTARQVKYTAAAGGRFIISPNTDKKIIKCTKRAGLVSIPGAMTPTEIYAASSAGADFVKVFPAGELRASYIKTIRVPFCGIDLLAYGGITLDNIDEYSAAGVCGFGIGSAIIDRDALNNNDYETITAAAAKFVAAAKSRK